MDTARASIYKLHIHEHPLFPSTMFVDSACAACHVDENMYGGYFCNEASCYIWVHKECTEAPLEINHHPSHPEHHLLLTHDSPTRDGTPCDICGKKLLSPYYTCPTCEFKVDFICGMKPSPYAIEQPVSHNHALVFLKKREEEEVSCKVCKESINGPSYSCPKCDNVYFHLDCVNLSKEVNHPCHPSHPLTIMASESLIEDDAKKSCLLCSVQPEKVLYHCSICNFTVCLGCTKCPPPLFVDHTNTHMHPLWLFPRKITFICNVCGFGTNNANPYICRECDFVVEGNCIGLPRVININRHDHRISFTHHLGHGRAKCGVCRKHVSRYYGAYSCSVCLDYAVHTECAIDFTVWNGVELEGIPDISEDVTPFMVVGDNLIRHFSHAKHTLRLFTYYSMVRDDYEKLRCVACVCPIEFGPIYSCSECHFVLHEKCANLPMKKKLVFSPTVYKLVYDHKIICCNLCGIISSGFTYISQGSFTLYYCIDVRCGSLSEPFIHNGHVHPLYFGKTENHCCNACKRVLDNYMLTCSTCEFDLCLYCATLPEKIWHMSDEHLLTLYFGEKTNGKKWCEVCEMELDPNKWFFTCSDCEVTFHVQCVVGDFSRLNPNCYITFGGKMFLVVLNSHNNRPFCRHCHYRCKVSNILKVDDKENGYICSVSCLHNGYSN